uniref:Transmembrane protein n=1 Tax=Glossina pallidipes TaxID=7398 RepID=A0A1A9ZLG8_GLOPL
MIVKVKRFYYFAIRETVNKPHNGISSKATRSSGDDDLLYDYAQLHSFNCNYSLLQCTQYRSPKNRQINSEELEKSSRYHYVIITFIAIVSRAVVVIVVVVLWFKQWSGYLF